MPLIPYPNIPIAAGVPSVARVGQVAPGASTRSVSGVSTAPASFASWSILTSSFQAAITPDSFVALAMKNDSRISSHPVEQGQFSSYNKIGSPYELWVRMTCGGQGAMSRHEFIATLEQMQASTDLYTIITPDNLYSNANMTSYDYRREAGSGATMIIVEARFEEVRVTGVAEYQSTKSVNGANPVSYGSVTPSTPSQAVVAAANKIGFQ
jgi:hypothetical protein